MKYSKYIKSAFETALLVLITQNAFADNEVPGTYETDYYRVVDGQVDAETFIGYNVYHKVCVGCHGVGGAGTDLAPDLTVKMESLSPDLFNIKVLHKFAIKFTRDDWTSMEQSMFEEIHKQESRERGEIASMPRWENNPMVTNNIQNIYRYLRARSNGVIGPDKPGLLDK